MRRGQRRDEAQEANERKKENHTIVLRRNVLLSDPVDQLNVKNKRSVRRDLWRTSIGSVGVPGMCVRRGEGGDVNK